MSKCHIVGNLMHWLIYQGLYLTKHTMKIPERIVNSIITQVVSIDDSLFGVVPGRGTTDAAAEEISCSEQEALYDLRGSRENI